MEPGMLLMVACGAAALAGATLGWEVARQVTQDRLDYLREEPERRRRTRLREGSNIHRWFEPTIDALAWLNRKLWPEWMDRLAQGLELVEPLPWRPEEYLAVKQVECVPAFFAGCVVGYLLVGPVMAPLVGTLLYAFAPMLVARGVQTRARRHRVLVRNRLPFVIDLMALMLEAGATSLACLERVAQENRGHPVGQEFGRVWSNIEAGMTRAEALAEMSRRLDDPDVRDLVQAINTSEDRGTALESTLRDMSEQMRQRKVQWMEKAAEEAKVHITWPAMVVMVACLIIVVAPMLLAALDAGAGR
jgi:tight adherence protein C